MAASKMLREIVGDVTECPICTEVIVDSKVLPCIHTFCLKCLEQFWQNKKPGDQVPCPLCRTHFNIPEGGLSHLPRNYFVEKLLDAQKLSNTDQSIPTTCDICSSLKMEGDGVEQPAAQYCVDCKDNMCEQCARIHLIMKSSKLHRVVKLGELSKIETSKNFTLKLCNQHEDEKIKIYCLDCKTAVCPTCFIIKHNGHKCSDINEVAGDLKEQIKNDMEKTEILFFKVKEQSGNLEKILKDFVHDTKDTEVQIFRRGDEIKELVDQHVQSLLQDLNEEKRRKLKEFENVREELSIQIISLESFMKYSQEVLDKATPSDIACFAPDLRTRADNLTRMRIVPIGKQVKVSFIPSDLHIFIGEDHGRSIVGEISFSENICSKYKNIGNLGN